MHRTDALGARGAFSKGLGCSGHWPYNPIVCRVWAWGHTLNDALTLCSGVTISETRDNGPTGFGRGFVEGDSRRVMPAGMALQRHSGGSGPRRLTGARGIECRQAGAADGPGGSEVGWPRGATCRPDTGCLSPVGISNVDKTQIDGLLKGACFPLRSLPVRRGRNCFRLSHVNLP